MKDVQKKGKTIIMPYKQINLLVVYKIYKLITNHFNTYVITVNTRKEANTFGKYIQILFILFFYGFFFY